MSAKTKEEWLELLEQDGYNAIITSISSTNNGGGGGYKYVVYPKIKIIIF